MISTASLHRPEAVLLASTIQVMRGAVEHLRRRSLILKRVLDLWPEIQDAEAPEKFNAEETRKLTLDEFDKRALGEGLLNILAMPNSNGSDYAKCMEIAVMCRISKWFAAEVEKKAIVAFSHASDDEAELGD